MAKPEFGSAKYAASQLRRRGLQKTKFYCQVCEKQCLDENGFKLHIQSPSHIRRLNDRLGNSNNNSRALIREYSGRFLGDFLRLLRINHGEKLIGCNRFYQEYIMDKNHVHLNSTRWKSLTSLVMFLKHQELCRVEENEDYEEFDAERYSIAYIDKSAKKPSKEQKIRSDEESASRMLQEQIERGRKLKEEQEQSDKSEEVPVQGLENHDKIKISMNNKPLQKCGIKIVPGVGHITKGQPQRRNHKLKSRIASKNVLE
ncbi:hypothetical protein OGAPHI_002333 [Ogataea philodendri]|uniref:C2H2-type domain-containing protein n=1 Tax=Ogataea philodendri TaxID=1378263 RepID=A0A9P8PC75_9ASCO|nr:uncharacterized protein OGAPHI_002333 [Ogataea philodendri]KAH3668579.1 hypothetical protein OGAPHI_002333 [Ogataea philodendri]